MKRLPVVLYAVGLAGPLLAARPADEPAKTPQALREAVLKAATPDAKAKAYRAWFTAVGKAGLPALTKDPDISIALQAAWEVNKKPAKRGRPLDGRTDDVYDPAELKKFVTCLADRTKVNVPSWWAGTVTDVDVFPGQHHAFLGGSLYRGWDRKKTDVGELVEVTGGSGLERRGKDLVYSAGGRAVAFPAADVLPEPVGMVTGVFAGKRAVLAVSRPWGGTSFPMYGLAPEGGKPTWTAAVWGAGRTILLGQAPHRVDLAEKDSTVFAFGAESHGAYVEGFDLKSGRCQFRFCSGYWFHFSEEWDLK